MSWLARSLANSLRLDDEQELKNDMASDASHHQHHLQSSPAKHETSGDQHQNEEIESSSPLLPEEEAQSRGVKEDLTELKQTLTKQLWGVASFLAPPPPPPPPPLTHRPVDSCHRSIDRSASNLNQSEPSDRPISEGEEQPSDLEAVSRISGGFAEIGGSFRSGVSGISKMALNYFPFGSEENERESLDEIEQGNEEFDEVEEVREEEEEESWEDAVGITDEVLAFAGNIAMHPETWLDFPLDEEEDLDDFDISDAQQKHALAIEYLAPRLAALRFELCPCHMSESYFWKVYFVLLHSRLNKHDAEILSTPQVMEARALWMQELQKQTKLDTDWFGRSFSKLKDDSCVLKVDLQHPSCNDAPPDFLSPRIYAFEPPPIMTTDYETVKHPVESSEIQYIDKTVVEEKPVILTEDKNPIVGQSSKIQIPDYEDDEYLWPEDEDLEFGGCGRAPICPGDEEDISFSDLEDDGDCNVPIKSKIVTKGSES